MSDPRHMHEFLPNRVGRCKQYVGAGICHLPEDADVHRRFAEAQAQFEEDHLGVTPDRADDEWWAIERVRDMATNARTDAERLGPKLLRGFGYPNEVMHDAQDALALEIVLRLVGERGYE